MRNRTHFLILIAPALLMLGILSTESEANRALTTAATALQAQQAQIERISHDLANVNTDAYKRGQNEFSDLMYQTIKKPGDSLGANTQSPVGIQLGHGVKVGAIYKNFEQGPTRMTYNPYDIMIEGRGFFTVLKENGVIAYTRNGSFNIDGQGRLRLSSGDLLQPQITIPNNALNIRIKGNGEVEAVMPGNELIILGQIQLTNFQNPAGLIAEGAGLYSVSPASGEPIVGIPGENGVGLLQQGALEGANVNVANSMVEMITAQRAYEMGTKIMKVADEMMGATANIK